MGSYKGMSENLEHGFGLGQLSDTRVRPTLHLIMLHRIWNKPLERSWKPGTLEPRNVILNSKNNSHVDYEIR